MFKIIIIFFFFLLTIILSNFLHEVGHLIVGKRFGLKPRDVKLFDWRPRIVFEGSSRQRKAWFFTSIAGCVMNGVVACIALIASLFCQNLVIHLIVIIVGTYNCCLFLNLLPCCADGRTAIEAIRDKLKGGDNE